MGKRSAGGRGRRHSPKDTRGFGGGGFGFGNILWKIRNLYGGPGRGFGKCGGFGWFTPVRCCICGGILCTLIFSGVGLYGIVIIGLLLFILQLFC